MFRMLLSVLPEEEATIFFGKIFKSMDSVKSGVPVILAKIGAVNAYVSYILGLDLDSATRDRIGILSWHELAKSLLNQLFCGKPDSRSRQYLELQLNWINIENRSTADKIRSLEAVFCVAQREANCRIQNDCLQGICSAYRQESISLPSSIFRILEVHQMDGMHDAVGLVKSLHSYGSGRPILHQAVLAGYVAVVRLLLEQGVDNDVGNEVGLVALCLAVENGHEAIVQFLLKHKTLISTDSNINGKTALHLAAENGHQAIVQLMLKHGADISAKTTDEVTALHLAAGNGHEAIVLLLLEHEADNNAVDKDGWTALHWAAGRWYFAVVYLLLEYVKDINAKDKDGKTALYLAAKGEHEAMVQLLLEHGAEANAKASDGKTALHFAAESGDEVIVQLLLGHGAYVNAGADINGNTAFYLAAQNGHDTVIKLLLDNGAIEVDSRIAPRHYGTLHYTQFIPGVHDNNLR